MYDLCLTVMKKMQLCYSMPSFLGKCMLKSS